MQETYDFTPVEIKLFVDGLEELLEITQSFLPEYPDLGICANLNEHLGDKVEVYDMVKLFAKGWAYHTGDINYPVPLEPGQRRVAGCSDQNWKGNQLVLRRDLMNYMIGAAYEY